MRSALVFGGSGQIGQPLIQRLRAGGWHVTALSRSSQRDDARLRWLSGGFEAMPPLPARLDAIISAGPLDHIGRWYAG